MVVVVTVGVWLWGRRTDTEKHAHLRLFDDRQRLVKTGPDQDER